MSPGLEAPKLCPQEPSIAVRRPAGRGVDVLDHATDAGKVAGEEEVLVGHAGEGGVEGVALVPQDVGTNAGEGGPVGQGGLRYRQPQGQVLNRGKPSLISNGGINLISDL